MCLLQCFWREGQVVEENKGLEISRRERRRCDRAGYWGCLLRTGVSSILHLFSCYQTIWGNSLMSHCFNSKKRFYHGKMELQIRYSWPQKYGYNVLHLSLELNSRTLEKHGDWKRNVVSPKDCPVDATFKAHKPATSFSPFSEDCIDELSAVGGARIHPRLTFPFRTSRTCEGKILSRLDKILWKAGFDSLRDLPPSTDSM